MPIRGEMRCLTSLALFFLYFLLATGGAPAYATGFQIGAGGLTPHYGMGPGYRNYCEQIGKSDVIYNRTYYVRVEGQRNALTFLIGYDSICSPIQGLFYTYKLFEGKWFGFGFTAGAYRFNMDNWTYEENHAPPGKIAVTPVYTTLGKDKYFVPFMGAEFNLAMVHEGTWSLWWNALVTPIIANISLSLKKTF